MVRRDLMGERMIHGLREGEGRKKEVEEEEEEKDETV